MSLSEITVRGELFIFDYLSIIQKQTLGNSTYFFPKMSLKIMKSEGKLLTVVLLSDIVYFDVLSSYVS